MKIFLNWCFLLFSLNISAQQTISTNPDSLTKIKRGQYSLRYPNLWTTDTSKMFGMDLLLRSPKADSLDPFIENLNVFVQDLHGQDYTLARMGQESEKQIKNMVTDVEIIESRLDSAASYPYYTLAYKGRQGKFLLTTEQRFYLNDEIGFALTFTVQNGKEEEYRMVAKKIFDSFELVSQPSPNKQRK